MRGLAARTIGVAAPWADSESSEPSVYIEVKDRSVATSGKSRRGFQINDRWYSHVFDPRSAWPVERVSAATVVAERGADADALAKICGVLEPEESLRLVNSLARSRVPDPHRRRPGGQERGLAPPGTAAADAARDGPAARRRFIGSEDGRQSEDSRQGQGRTEGASRARRGTRNSS